MKVASLQTKGSGSESSVRCGVPAGESIKYEFPGQHCSENSYWYFLMCKETVYRVSGEEQTD